MMVASVFVDAEFTGIRDNKSKDFRSFVLVLPYSANKTVYYK